MRIGADDPHPRGASSASAHRKASPPPRTFSAHLQRAAPAPPSPRPARSPPAISDAFLEGLARMGRRLRIDPRHVVAVMWFESRIDPRAQNPTSRATGLIQFMPAVAAQLLGLPSPDAPPYPGPGATGRDFAEYGRARAEHQQAVRAREAEAAARLSRMSPEEQLELVEKYFEAAAPGRALPTLRDVYMAVFWPAAIGKGDGFVVARAEAPGAFERLVYAQNRGLDANHDGAITAGEAAALVEGAARMPGAGEILARLEPFTKTPARSVWA